LSFPQMHDGDWVLVENVGGIAVNSKVGVEDLAEEHDPGRKLYYFLVTGSTISLVPSRDMKSGCEIADRRSIFSLSKNTTNSASYS